MAKNHLGEREFQTFAGWKRACKKICEKANTTLKIEGDKDIASAFSTVPEFPGEGSIVALGQWEGDKGSIFN